MYHRIETEESAICALPFRLTVSGVLFASILLLSSVSVYGFLDEVKERQVMDEVLKLKDAAEQLSIRGEGSEICLEFRVPEGVTVDFGTLPDNLNKWPADANNYCVRIGGKSKFYSSAAFFSNPEISGPISLSSGLHRLMLSTKTDSSSGKLFVRILDKDL